jgi:hypothetical protein
MTREQELAALPALLSVSEAAQAARCSGMTIKRALKAGQLLKNGTSKRWSRITKDSLLVFISLRASPAPSQHDVPINEQYEDLRRCEQRTPEPETASGEDTDFARECAHYAALLPSVERRFLHAHPAPFNFEDYFR